MPRLAQLSPLDRQLFATFKEIDPDQPFKQPLPAHSKSELNHRIVGAYKESGGQFMRKHSHLCNLESSKSVSRFVVRFFGRILT